MLLMNISLLVLIGYFIFAEIYNKYISEQSKGKIHHTSNTSVMISATSNYINDLYPITNRPGAIIKIKSKVNLGKN